jgi:hypothetical protein
MAPPARNNWSSPVQISREIGVDHKTTFSTRTRQKEDGGSEKETRQTIEDQDGNVIFEGTTTEFFNQEGKKFGKHIKRSDGRIEAIEAPQPQEPLTEPKSLYWNRPASYSLSLGPTIAARGFNNKKTFDHLDLGGRLSFGLKILEGRQLQHTLLPRLFYAYHMARNPFTGLIRSEAQVHTVGAEINYLFEAVPNWLFVGAAAGLGASIVRSADGEYGLQGVQYNHDDKLRRVDESGFHVEVGPKLCTWGLRVCLDARFASELSLDPAIGGDLREPLNSPALEFGVLADIMQFFSKPTPKGYLANHIN